MVNFSGLIYHPRIPNKINTLSTIKANGGEDCQTVRVCIKKSMVNFNSYLGDFYTGNFKNGLKHGEGI